MLSCEYFLDSASERGMTRARHPAHNAGSRRGQARLSFTGAAGIYLMRYSHFARSLWIPRRGAE